MEVGLGATSEFDVLRRVIWESPKFCDVNLQQPMCCSKDKSKSVFCGHFHLALNLLYNFSTLLCLHQVMFAYFVSFLFPPKKYISVCLLKYIYLFIYYKDCVSKYIRSGQLACNILGIMLTS